MAVRIRNQKSEIGNRKSPLVIGLTGGIASGKSAVARMFAQLGAAVIDADEIAREVLESEPVKAALRREWGETVFRADGSPDRAKIADMVFGDAAKLDKLNRIVHPPVLNEMRARLDKAAADPSVLLIVIDAPLLMEGKSGEWCDMLLFVEAAPGVRAKRAAARGWGPEELARREARQTPLEEKRRRADAVVRNDGEESETFEQVKSLFGKWKRKS